LDGTHCKLGVDSHYFSTDENKLNIEKHRKIYAETALLNLRIENRTPNQREELIDKLDKENRDLKNRLAKIEKLLFKEQPEDIPKEVQERMDKQVERAEEFMKNHELVNAKREEEDDKYLNEHPEIVEQVNETYQRTIERRLDQLEDLITELTNAMKKNKDANT